MNEKALTKTVVFVTAAVILILFTATAVHFFALNRTDKNTFAEESLPVSVTAGVVLNEETDENAYFVAGNGTKYHLAHCNYVKNAKELYELSENAAKYGEYQPCKVCIK